MTTNINLDSQILRAKDVQRLLNVSRQHSYNLMKKMPRIQIGVNAWGVKSTDFQSYLNSLNATTEAGGENE